MKRFGLVTVLVLVVGSLPASASYQSYPEYDGAGFQALYDHAVANTLPNLEYPDERYSITGSQALDDRIWERALERGYRLRPTATGPLASVGGVRMQPQAAAAWEGLRAEVRTSGLGFTVSSAYRSPATQRSTFLSRLNGTSDSAIDAALTWWSLPGASKHHGGYALDFRYPNGTFGQFRSTPAHGWLSADNFAIPKRYGLIPSYPDDVADQGPNPEPWEYVWVGTSLVLCGLPQSLGPITGPAAALVEDIARCPGGQAPALVPDWLGS